MSRISLGKAILFTLEKTVDGVVRLEDFTSNTHIYAAGYDRPLKKTALAQALKRLREDGLIEKHKNQGQIILKLTDAGRSKAVLSQILDPSEWDKRWRIVLFDIPEQKRAIRFVLRKKLKEWGFRMWQQSVWVTKKDCTKPLREFLKDVGIEKWVMVIESDNVGEFTF